MTLFKFILSLGLVFCLLVFNLLFLKDIAGKSCFEMWQSQILSFFFKVLFIDIC